LNLTEPQRIIARDNHRFRILRCGRRFGKTTLAIEEMFTIALTKKGRRIAYYAPTRDDARDIAWNMLVDRCAPVMTYKNESLLEIKIRTLDGGESLIVLYGWESVRERGKGRGLANDFIVCDEVPTYKDFWLGWNEVLSPTLIDRRGSAMFIGTPKGFNHFYDLYNKQEKDDTYKSFHFTSYDNPNIPADEIEREKKSKPEDTFSQEYLAEFRKKQGLVYPEFNRDIHLFDDATPYRKIETIAGIDFGFTNPSVILVIDRDHDDTYWVRKEWYRTGKTNAELIEVAKTMGVNIFYPDPAEPDRIEEMKRAGLNVRDVIKDIPTRIDKVRTLIKNNKLRFHKDCVNLISEIEMYSWTEKQTGKNEPELPVKEYDHAMDALGMALTMNAPLAIEEKGQEFNLYSESTYG